jgi:ubiquinone/menaquinone biosynthesis C-methylase UbiE
MKKSFWDSIAGVYDLFERLYNKRCYDGTGAKVASYIEDDSRVLECACGTGSISRFLAQKASRLTAADLSDGMLRQAAESLQKGWKSHNPHIYKYGQKRQRTADKIVQLLRSTLHETVQYGELQAVLH